MLKIFLMVTALLAGAFFVFLLQQGKASANIAPPVLSDNDQLPACSDKPNCVSSAAAPTDQVHYIEPMIAPDISMAALESAIENDGGTRVTINGNLLTAKYTSRLFGFIDDVLLLKTPQHIAVYSSSRVGYSDLNANRKRVERLRASIAP